MIRDVSPQAVFFLCSTFHRCLHRLYLSSSYRPFHCMFLTSQTSYYKGQATLLCFRGSMSGTSRRMRLMISVSVLCAEKQNTFLYPLLFSLVAFTSFSRNHYTACQLQFTKGIINRERFSAHLESMLGTWVYIRAMISELPLSAASCNEFHSPLFIRRRSASLFIKPLTA